jgi:hypothetical protein
VFLSDLCSRMLCVICYVLITSHLINCSTAEEAEDAGSGWHKISGETEIHHD